MVSLGEIMKSSRINNYSCEFNNENYMEEIKKYINVRNRRKKLSLYSLGIAIILMGILLTHIININEILIIIFGLLIIDIIVFIFNFASYLSYISVIKLMEKHKIVR